MPGSVAPFNQVAAQYMSSNPDNIRLLLHGIIKDSELNRAISSVTFGKAEKPRNYRVDLLRSFHQHEPAYNLSTPNLKLPGISDAPYQKKLNIANNFLKQNMFHFLFLNPNKYRLVGNIEYISNHFRARFPS